MRVFQWIAPVLLPAFLFIGRGMFGAPLGWMVLFAFVAGPFMVIAMYFAPIIVVFDRDARTVRSTRMLYDVASWVTWAALIVMMLTLVDGGDAPPHGSAVSTWGLMDSAASTTVFGFATLIAVIGWLGTLATAIAGVVSSHSPRRAVPVSGL